MKRKPTILSFFHVTDASLSAMLHATSACCRVYRGRGCMSGLGVLLAVKNHT